MSLRKAVLVAQDAAPSGCFERLELFLRKRGFDTNLLIGKGKSFPRTKLEMDIGWAIDPALTLANIVILGMSSSDKLAILEIISGESANTYRIPYGFYGDVPGCWGRARPGSWFEHLASNASFYFAIDEQDAKEAQKVFPKAKCIATGNPLREEMAFPKFTREEVHAKLGIAPDEKLVLAPGDKFAAGNMAMWTTIIDALGPLCEGGMYENGIKVQLVLSTHPGDRTPQELYQELVSFSPIPTRIVTKDILSSSDMVPGADIIIGSGGSICIEGAYQQIPIVCLLAEVMMQRIEKINGSRKIEAVDNGIAEFVSNDKILLYYTIRQLLNPNDSLRLTMQQRQRELCPKPTERGAALRKMAEAIVQICDQN